MAIPEDCIYRTDAPRIPLRDKKTHTRVMILNPARGSVDIVKVDGCVIKNGLRADWLVRQIDVGSAIVELKGEDVGHGMAQIEATLDFCFRSGDLFEPIGALIMGRCIGVPQTKRQIVTNRLRSKYGARLRFSSSVNEFAVADLV